MRLDLATLEQDDRERILAGVLRVLAASPRFWKPSRWKNAVVIHTPEERRVTDRLELVASFRASGLEAEAHELAHRRVNAGELLVWLVHDTEAAAMAGFVVLDLAELAR
jgi:hypothetical protein